MFHFTTNNDTIRVFQTWINTLINHYPAVGAGLSGAKMARRTGSVDEFEFKAIGFVCVQYMFEVPQEASPVANALLCLEYTHLKVRSWLPKTYISFVAIPSMSMLLIGRPGAL